MPQHSGKVWYIKNSICAFIYCILTSLGFNITALVSVLQDAVHGHIQSEEDNFATQTPGRSSQNEKQRGSHWAGVYKIMIRRENKVLEEKKEKKKPALCAAALTWQKQTLLSSPQAGLCLRGRWAWKALAAVSGTRLTAGLPTGHEGSARCGRCGRLT